METQQNSAQNSFLKNQSPEYLNPEEMDDLIAKVEKLCTTIDPFQGLTEKEKEQLRAWGIEWENPYDLTNKLVKWLEDMIELRQSQRGETSNLS